MKRSQTLTSLFCLLPWTDALTLATRKIQSNHKESKTKNSSAGPLATIVILAVIIVVLLFIIFYMMKKRRAARDQGKVPT